MNCEACGRAAKRKALQDGKWVCSRCLRTIPCPRCGELTKAGIERFMIQNADTDEYSLLQNIGYICPSRHVTVGDIHHGPGYRSSQP